MLKPLADFFRVAPRKKRGFRRINSWAGRGSFVGFFVGFFVPRREQLRPFSFLSFVSCVRPELLASVA